jgi:DNA-binding NarL/FixJ family response regulator
MNTPATLYLADDHQMIIDGLKLLVSTNPTVKVLGYANNVDRARADIINWRPDLALIDLRMPGPELNDGLDLIYELKKKVPTKFIVLSMHDAQRYIRDAMGGGASGYLLKNAGQEELKRCLTTVMNGDLYFPGLKTRKEQQRDKPHFTPTETEVLKLVLKNYTTIQIAEQLVITENTAKTHRRNICRKTNENTPLGFIKYLQEHSIKL